MEKYCKLCGDVLPEGVGYYTQHHQFKKMCLNCAFAQDNGEDVYLCTNEENKNTVKKRMLDAAAGVSEAYKVTDFDIAPLPLKKVTGKCKQWVLNEEVLNSLKELFV